MSHAEHEHRWGSWNYAGYSTETRTCTGYSTETRTCTCGNCTGAEYRQHNHTYRKSADVFAPMGSSLTIEVCAGPTGCGDTKRGT